MLLQDFQHAGSVVLHAGLAYALDLGQVSLAIYAPLHHLGQLFVGKDRVDRDSFFLGNLLSQVAIVYLGATGTAVRRSRGLAIQEVHADGPERGRAMIHEMAIHRQDAVIRHKGIQFPFAGCQVLNRDREELQRHG